MSDMQCMDGNEAVARVAYRLNEVIAIYPITPASPMGEWADAWSAAGTPNLWGQTPAVVELQSEGGAAGTVHGALQAGALTTTFTASQGLLLMIPNLYRWAGELTPVVVHVAGRALAAQGLSIFGDHSDAMAARATGCAILTSASVQEAGDFAAIASRASFTSRVPFLHLFDGFRTSHEIQKVEPLSDAVLRELAPLEAMAAHRGRALTPERPVLRGTAQNPDVYFQGRESVNRFYEELPLRLKEAMQRFAALTGRSYEPYEYAGDPLAERVVVLMGSACETAVATARRLAEGGERLGVLKVRLFRPLRAAWLVAALPPSARAIAVLDRCKEPGAAGEPLYLDVVTAVAEQWRLCHGDGPLPVVVGGRYGLGSKDFTPAMAKAVFDNLAAERPRNHFTIGIHDDLSQASLPVEAGFHIDAADEVRAVFYGLGSDGTVGANKNTIKIIGESTPLHAQGYFVYDSKKSGSLTVSHLRFGPRPIQAPYLIERPTLVAVHQWDVLAQLPVLEGLVAGGTLLLNSPHGPASTWRQMPEAVRRQVRRLEPLVWQINAARVARQAGMGGRINTVMQAAFFAVSDVLPRQEALEKIREAIRHSYGKKGEAVVRMNLQALEGSLAALEPLDWRALDGELAAERAAERTGEQIEEQIEEGSGEPAVPALAGAPAFVREVIAPMLAHRGDGLPVSALPCDGTWPTGTARWEKRNIADAVPVWESDLCVQCGKCLLVCPHAVIRAKVAAPEALVGAPEGFRLAPARDPAFAGQSFTIQVGVEDCTGCQLCVEVCPARDRQEPARKALNMAPQRPLRERGRAHWDYFLSLAEVPRAGLNLRKISQQQLQQPLFEFSGACAGCGETPYLKLLSQLFGDRLLIANATGCSSIYGGNLPTTPWTTNGEGRGPAWSNSLFEDNAEFGYGMRVALDQRRATALALLAAAGEGSDPLPVALVEELVAAAERQGDEAAIYGQRQRLMELKRLLAARLERLPAAERGVSLEGQLLAVAEALVKTSVWLVGGDGWAYDIGFGGLDHVLASGRDVNALVLDTEVYSNTGGQASKATPLGAVAKFASGGKAAPKKDLGLMAITYGTVYVASVAMGAKDEHTIRTFLEAESYPGPSLIIAYSHCIAHGIDMAKGMEQQRLAVDSGRWLLYRYDPRRLEQGLSPLQIDSGKPRRAISEAMATENRFRMLGYGHPERARALEREAQAQVRRRWGLYQALAQACQPEEPVRGEPAVEPQPPAGSL
ncbi:MAG: pyruvate:ferredoxin (flavodoxin) oxidoreductase [Cyanobacteriota bacterium]|nr:pyruvate:ferredoxin (flavodoxin) oxidoreductase [Cyanobacteriota bacterium]